MMESEIRTVKRPDGETERLQTVRLPDWESLAFFRPQPAEDPLPGLLRIYRQFLVPSAPWIFGQMALLRMPEEADLPGAVTAPAGPKDRLFGAAGRLKVVGDILEHQPFVQGAERGGKVAEVVGRANYQAVGAAYGVQNRRQAVAADAAALVCLSFAAEARDASGVFFKAEQVEALHFGACGFRSFDGFFYKRVGVPAYPGAGVYGYDLLAHVCTSVVFCIVFLYYPLWVITMRITSSNTVDKASALVYYVLGI